MRTFIRTLAPLALALALLIPAGTATAAPATSERTESFVFYANNCNGETLQGDVSAHIVFKEQKDGTVIQHVKTHGQVVGDQGNEYIVNESFNFKSADGQIEFDNRVQLISKGSVPNQAVRVRFKNGDFTAEFLCRG